MGHYEHEDCEAELGEDVFLPDKAKGCGDFFRSLRSSNRITPESIQRRSFCPRAMQSLQCIELLLLLRGEQRANLRV
jgi:hypothetical protein